MEKNTPTPVDAPSAGIILIVEDEEDLAVLLEYNLKKAGYRVHIADNGRKALQLAEGILPDVILLDILLPEMTGWDVCRTLREHAREEVTSIPIIMLTALRDDQDKYRGLDLGADVFIRKPYAIQEVLLHCRNLVHRRKRHLSLILKENTVRNNHKEDMYTILFHELKNQLTIIGGMSGFLGRKNRDPRERRYIRAIQMSADYLETIAGEINTLERLCDNGGTIEQEIISLKEQTNEVIALIFPLAHRKNIGIHLACRDSPLQCRQDKTAVKVILVVLLENAVKYSPPHSTVRIELKESAGQLMIAVTDNGPGIELDEQARIFDKSYRGRQTRHSCSGTGLGLYIARKLADAMRTSLSVKSTPGEGSIFTFLLPV